MQLLSIMGVLVASLAGNSAAQADTSGRTSARRTLSGGGAHRNLSTSIAATVPHHDSHANCRLLLLERLPPSVYVDLGQTAPPPGTQILAHHAVNPEVMAEMSGPTPLLLRATAAEDAEGVVIDRMDTVTTIRWNVWMEVHLRYFYAKQGVDYTTVVIDAPTVFYRCDAAVPTVEWGAKEVACLAAGRAGDGGSAGDDGGAAAAAAAAASTYTPPTVAELVRCLTSAGWTEGGMVETAGTADSTNDSIRLELVAPVGRVELSAPVMVGTLFCTIAGACVLAASIVRHSGDDALKALAYSFGVGAAQASTH